MPKKHLISQLFLPFFLLTLLSTLLLIWYANRTARQLYLHELETNLTSWARLAANLTTDSSRYPNKLDSLALILDQSSNIHFTFIDSEGNVLSNSRHQTDPLENLIDRPEVRDAILGKIGISIRRNQSRGELNMFLALPREESQRRYPIVRVAMPTLQIEKSLTKVFVNVGIGWSVLFLIVVSITLVIARNTTRPLQEMQLIATKFASGELDLRIPAASTIELAELTIALNDMAQQLSNRIHAITRQRNELEAILASMIESVIAIDNQDRILMVNRAAERLLGIAAPEVFHRTLHEVIRVPDLVKFISDLPETNKNLEMDLILNGEAAIIHVRGTSIFDANQRRIGRVIVINDITRLRQLETVRRDFVANVSHELRTPITSIRGSAETLRDGALDDSESAIHFVEMIVRNAERMNTIVEDLLSLARLEQEDIDSKLNFVADSIPQIVESTIEFCRPKAESKHITIIQQGEAPEVRCNHQLLEEAISNLIDNAIKYSEPESIVTIVISADAQEVSIHVVDSGLGIENRHLPRLFERFYRVDPSRSRQEGGTGLGLAIVKHIALAHRGRVSVTSVVGQGSTFGIHIPLG